MIIFLLLECVPLLIFEVNELVQGYKFETDIEAPIYLLKNTMMDIIPHMYFQSPVGLK